MNTVMIIPTGIGCEIGGHAGDATPAARLLASVSDTLILHPNVVNASDINEMPHNSLYVDGAMLDNFLEGKIDLQRVKSNKILVAVNKPVRPETVNAVSAARATLGIDAFIMELDVPLKMIGFYRDDDGRASGKVTGYEALVHKAKMHRFDALAIATEIDVPRDVALKYFKEGGVNPWGGVEAMASRHISELIQKPVAHAPVEFSKPDDPELYNYNEIVDPRIAAEAVSQAYLHCVLKGLHKAPRIGPGVSVNDIDCMVSPAGCFGRPHKACEKNNIPVIHVRENETIFGVVNPWPIVAETYLEAAGIIAAMREGISLESLRRPLPITRIY